MHNLTRRGFLSRTGAATAASTVLGGAGLEAAVADQGDSFLRTPPELAHEIVSVSHFDVDRVRELLSGRSVPLSGLLGLGIRRLGVGSGGSLPHGPARHRPASHRSRCQTQPVHSGHAGSGRRRSSSLRSIFGNPKNSWPAWDHSSSPRKARQSRSCRGISSGAGRRR